MTLKSFFGFFSLYAHPFERKVNRFFKSIRSTSTAFNVHRQLEPLMQENLVVLNLWMEKKYKNYVYLRKWKRKKMYENVEILKRDFLAFAGSPEAATAMPPLRSALERLDLPLPGLSHSESFLHLASIMAYLRPQSGRYEYQTSANFGKLLKNPLEEKLIGDCNQIVTLYVFLYSLKFPLSDLRIKILPSHVCLHFEGIDIEATNGTFQHYQEGQLLPITELLSTNLLDIADTRVRTAEIDPRTLVKRAQLAYHLSSFRDIVTRNLNASYQQLIVSLLDQKQYASAIFFAEKLADPEWIKKVYRHATSEALARSDFSLAETYINRSGDGEMREVLYHNQGVYYYKRGQFDRALSCFQKTGNTDMINACYQREYSECAKRVHHVKTIAEAKRYRSTYQKMLSLARKANLDEAAESVQRILRQL